MSQSVNFGSASSVNFNGSSVSQVNLNGSQIWAGTSTFTSTFSDTTEGKISVQRMGYKSSVMPNEGSFDSSRGSPGANRNGGLSGGAVFEGIWLESFGDADTISVGISNWYSTSSTPFSNLLFRGKNFVPVTSFPQNYNREVFYYGGGVVHYRWKLWSLGPTGTPPSYAYNGWVGWQSVYTHSSYQEYKFT